MYSGKHSFVAWLFVCAPLILGQWAGSASAVLSIEVQNVVLDESASTQNGFFDVFVTLAPLDPVPAVTGFDLGLALTRSGQGVAFTSVDVPLAPHPYVFGTQPLLPPNVFTDDQLMTQEFLQLLGSEPLDDLDGLIRVFFEVAPGTSGTFPIEIDPANTRMADDGFDPLPIPYEVINGAITIRSTSTGVVPEPLTALLVPMGIAAIAMRRMRLSISR